VDTGVSQRACIKGNISAFPNHSGMKKRHIPAILIILGALIIFAGCTSTEVPSPATPIPTAVPVSSAPTTVPQPSFSLGDHYLQRSYSFSNGSDVYSEQFYVDDPSWGIDFNITSLNDNTSLCWFTLDVIDSNTNQTDHYGFGRTFSNETDQKIPRYATGPFQFQMKGNFVKVVVTAAKRYP